MTDIPPNNPTISYTSRDYASIYADLISLAPSFIPEWTSRSVGDFMIVLIQMFSYVGDILSYYEDRNLNEAFLSTATQLASVLNLAAMLNYIPSLSSAALATIQFTVSSNAVGPITIPAGTQVATLGSPTQGPIIFQTSDDLTIAGANSATPSVIGQVEASQGVSITGEAVATSDGTMGQTYSLANPLVTQGSITIYVDEGSGPVAWTQVPYLIDYDSQSLVYSISTDQNNITYIQFGDDTNGSIPSLDSPITADYVVGVGSAGNVGAQTIVQPISVIAGVTGITNPSAASGGTDPESINSIRQNAPAALRSLGRAVSLPDYQALALQVPGVARAQPQSSNPTLVNMWIAPNGGGAPSAGLLAEVESYFVDDYRLIAGTSLTLLSPAYVPINIAVTLYILPQSSASATALSVQAALGILFSLVATDFNQTIPISMVYLAIQSVAGVGYATITQLVRNDDDNQDQVINIVMNAGELPIITTSPVITTNGGLT